MSMSGRQSVGHPVDVASGVMFNDLTDCWIPGKLPLSFRRFYSTGLLTGGTPFTISPGWRHNFELELKQDLEGYTFTDEKGGRHALPDRQDLLNQTGKLTVPAVGIELTGAGDVIELERYTAARGTKLLFRRMPGARTLRAEGVSWYPGVRLDFGFDRSGRLSEVAQSRSGRRLRFTYDALHRLRDVTLERPALLVLGLEYDARGRLIGVADSVGTKARYEYDDHGRILSEASRGGSIHTFRYDVDGRCVYASGTDRFEERQLAYDAKAHTTRVTDSHGQVTRYTYNDVGQVVEKQTPLGAVSQYGFDDLGRPTKELEAGIVKGELTYDELGCIISAAAPDGRKMELSYDQDHNIVRATDLAGRAWTYRFVNRRLVGSTNPLGQERSYETNEFGELVRETDALGETRRFGWDSEGNLQWSASPGGAAWWFGHDELGRTIEVRDPAGGIERRTYNSAGALTSQRCADGRVWSVEYDAADRPATWIYPDGSRARCRFNSCGQLIERIEADGSVRRFHWDTEPGRILAIEDGVGKRLSYTYDAEGRPITRRNWDGTEIKREYNALGKVIAATSAGGGRFAFEYDAFVRLSRRTDPDGRVVEFKWDDSGYIVEAKNDATEIVYERDLYGRITRETEGGTVTEHSYDQRGRLVRSRLPFGPEVRTDWAIDDRMSAISVGGYRIEFDYDPIGREVARHFPGGGKYRQSYDPVGRVLDQTYMAPRSYSQGKIPGQGGIGTDFARRYEYDAGGHMSLVDDSRQGTFQALHDPVGRLCAVLRDDGSSAFYDFDAADNRNFKAELPPGTGVRMDQVRVANPRSGIRFDLGRLEAAGADVEVSAAPATDPGNRITELRRPDSRTFFHHDADGRVVLKEVQVPLQPLRRWRYAWNANNTLASVITPEGEHWQYKYDALSRRISRRGPSQSTRYIWSGSRLLHVLNEGEAPRTRVPHPNRASTVAELRDGDIFFPLPDPVRATADIVDERGNAVWSNRRGPWGETPVGQARAADEGFAGQIYDPESGLYYNVFRYYDPQLGRFISPDPIGLLGGFNEYAFVPSPFDWLDADGLIATGGPHDYNGGTSPDGGGPDLRGTSPSGRQVTNSRTERTNNIPPPGAGNNDDGGGKTIAVLQTPDGKRDKAFVSGWGGKTQGDYPPGWNTSDGPYGNWCHAEMHALNSLRGTGPGAGNGVDYHLFIDRPPCDRCNGSLARALEDLKSEGINVKVHYMETEEEDGQKKVVWKDYPPKC